MRDNNKGSKQTDESLSGLFRNYNLSAQQIAVITALLFNTLEVESVLVDKDQTVQVLLQGSLRRKTRMDKLLDEVSEMPVGDLLDSLKKR